MKVNNPCRIGILGWWFRKGVKVYANGEKRDVEFNNDENLAFSLLDDDVRYEQDLEITIENPADSKGLKSKPYTLRVEKGLADEKVEQPQRDKSDLDGLIPTKEDSEEEGAPSDDEKNADKKILFHRITQLSVVCYNKPLK